MKPSFLGGLTPSRFLHDHWQKKPLLIRQAFPQFEGVIDLPDLLRLACDERAQARLVRKQRSGWRLSQGPFEPSDFEKLPRRDWTLLVHELDHFVPAAARLLRRFSFIPYARIDDVMVSYAVEGGSVGAHFDSYDVFLLQGFGERRWQISAQEDTRLIADAPLRLLADFVPEQEWLLAPGDMLYLPPRYAHYGVATSKCMTYSLGFRAPSDQEIATAFLDYLRDNVWLDGRYEDPDLKPQTAPASIGDSMLRRVARTLGAIRWRADDVERFLGIYLTEPKPHVYFEPPDAPLSFTRFRREAATSGVRLCLKSRALYRGKLFFINGDCHQTSGEESAYLRALADRREAAFNRDLPETLQRRLHEWYRDGYIEPGS